MKTIDIHAHLVPRSLLQATDAGREWYGFRPRTGQSSQRQTHELQLAQGALHAGRAVKDMERGRGRQVVSIHTPFFGYHLDPTQGRALARDVNDEIAG